MKLLIAGGGTGGHVFPAIAIAREWLSRGREREVVLVGTQRGIEMKLVPQAGLPLETLRAAGLKGKGGLTLLKNFATLLPGTADASVFCGNTSRSRRSALADMRRGRCCWRRGCVELRT